MTGTFLGLNDYSILNWNYDLKQRDYQIAEAAINFVAHYCYCI